MKTTIKMEAIATTKRGYTTPEIEEIRLDNEISLALESGPSEIPPPGPLEVQNFRMECNKNNHFDLI